ncbi:acyl-CoA synthase [Endozoicomonas sp. OPT23]|uniref:AMP-binding protein n=1 Tax=Endozoicomonas sp. OPT23 TaxID=2072845 RepID=UPI00129BD990|nr:AMP-binding protein [Endozoicomonas sp. OPT23]MRI31464.1 acyl-CoA synthase [Endozoicomonas sp. OPT23]
MSQSIFEAALARAAEGMEIAVVAEMDPTRAAVYSEFGDLTFEQLNNKINQLCHKLRSIGLKEGDPLALCCTNRPEFVIVAMASNRIGARLTPVNWHLAADEISYIVKDCEAKAFFADAQVGNKVAGALEDNQNLALSVSIGGDIEGFEAWNNALEGQSEANPENPVRGTKMLYTSGTSGRPKGVLRHEPDAAKAAQMGVGMTMMFQYQPETGKDKALVTGPLYHAGPFYLCMNTPLFAGISIVIMNKWEPEETLKIVEEHKITHSFFVPSMFVRLLQLDDSVRNKYNLSTLRFVIHGAAPCSIDTKKAMMDWFGPIIWELFSSTEGNGTFVSPQEWLAKPGTVGKPSDPSQIKIFDDEGNEVPAGESGRVFLKNQEDSRFEYYKDEEKTKSIQFNGYFTAGDLGHIDEDGYLFLTGRSAEVIISGGVNIYPQEIDDVIALHPAVADVACVGVPSEEWGEAVKAVVQLKPEVDATDELGKELISFASEKIARQKLPKGVDFIGMLPRSAAGKVQRRQLRDTYWEGRDRKI